MTAALGQVFVLTDPDPQITQNNYYFVKNSRNSTAYESTCAESGAARQKQILYPSPLKNPFFEKILVIS